MRTSRLGEAEGNPKPGTSWGRKALRPENSSVGNSPEISSTGRNGFQKQLAALRPPTVLSGSDKQSYPGDAWVLALSLGPAEGTQGREILRSDSSSVGKLFGRKLAGESFGQKSRVPGKKLAALRAPTDLCGPLFPTQRVCENRDFAKVALIVRA